VILLDRKFDSISLNNQQHRKYQHRVKDKKLWLRRLDLNRRTPLPVRLKQMLQSPDERHVAITIGNDRSARVPRYHGRTRPSAHNPAENGHLTPTLGRLSVRKHAIREITRDVSPGNVKLNATIRASFGKLLGAPLNDSRNYKRPFGAFCETLGDHFAGSTSHKVEHFVTFRPPLTSPEKIAPVPESSANKMKRSLRDRV